MSNALLKSTIMIVAVTMVGRLLGFFRNIFITNEFSGVETDAYFMAFTIPFTLFLVIPGAINSVLIPTMKGLMAEDQGGRRNEVFQKALTVCLILFALLSIGGMLWADSIINVLAHGFSESKKALTVELLQVMMPSAFFIGIIAVVSSVLNVHNEFFAPSLGTVINGLLVILSIYTLVPFMGVAGLAWGTLIGYVAFAFYLVLPLYKKSYRIGWNASVRRDPLMAGMGERFVPILLGMVISQLYLLLERFLVSDLGDLKLTSLTLANSIVQLPIGIFAGALAVPLFPLLSEYVKKKEMEQMKSVMRKGLLYQYHLLLPTTAGLVILSTEIVRFFYAHSPAFSQEAVQLTAWATIFYSVGMLGWAGRDMLTRVFYSVENTKTPVMIGGMSVIAYVGFAYVLIPPFDHGGIALAFSLASFFNFALQAFLLRRQIGALFTPVFYLSLAKGLVAAAVMSAGLWLGKGLSAGMDVLQVPVLVLIACILYFGTLVVFKEELVKDLYDKLMSKLRLR